MKVTDIENINKVIRFLKENKKYYPFYSFLRKNDCADKFFHNMIKDHIDWKEGCKNIDEPIIRYFKTVNCESFIDFAFYWGYSKEGFNFWEDLNKSWLRFVKNYKSFTYEKQENY